MNTLDLTVIIPVYNMEEFIEDCLISILDQDLSYDKYEIVVVDDCSFDDTVNIVNKYVKKYNHIKILIHDVNKKQGSARNTGINSSNGKYILFIDADDYFCSNVFSKLINECNLFDIEILCFDYYILKNNKREYIRSAYGHYSDGVVHGTDLLEKEGLLGSGLTWNAWSKMYKLSYLKNQKLFFEENVFFEDVDFVCKALYFSRRCLIYSIPIIYNRYNLNSTTASNNGLKLRDKIFMFERLVNFSDTVDNRFFKIKKNIKDSSLKRIKWCLARTIFLSSSEKKIFFKGLGNIQSLNIFNYVPFSYRFYLRYFRFVSILLWPLYPLFFFVILINSYRHR